MATRKLRWLALVVLVLAAGGGCAGRAARRLPAGRAPIRLLLLPVVVSLYVRHLKDVATPPEGHLGEVEERARIDARLRSVAETLHRDLLVRLDAAPGVIPVAPSAAARATALVGPWPDAARKRVAEARAAGAETVMEVELLGYGRVPQRWLVYLIGSGVVEGAVQGVVAARVVHNPWVGLGVLAEEIVQESLTWGGGALLFNAYYAPVTLRATLYDGHTGVRLWRKTVFVPVDRRRLRHRPEAERHRREVQLALTLDRAEARLVERLARVVAARPAP